MDVVLGIIKPIFGVFVVALAIFLIYTSVSNRSDSYSNEELPIWRKILLWISVVLLLIVGLALIASIFI